jgi:O-antigen/teichoic acid export membrane protein
MSVSLDEAPSPEGLGQRAAAGAVWMTAQKWVTRLTGLATIAILTRVLAPADFGVVAAASTILPLVYLLSDLGFSSYIVQVRETENRMLSTSFWFSASVGALLCLVLVSAAPLIALIYHLPALVPVLRVMTASVGLAALGSVPTALLKRKMAFRALALQGSAAALVGQVVAVAATLAGAGVWALVAQTVVAQAVTTGAAWVNARWRPSFTFSRAQFKDMVTFGGQVVGVDLIAFVRTWAETAIVASALGAVGLGYLAIAQRLIQVVQDVGAVALVQVSTVTFAKVRETSERLRNAYLRALTVAYAAVAPLLTFVAVAAGEIVPLLFGNQWGVSVAVAQGLAVAAIFTLGAMVDQGLFYGTGHPGRWFWYALIVDAVTVGTTAIAVRWGLVGVAIGFVVVAFLATVIRWVLVGRLLDTTAATVARPFAGISVPVVLSAAAGFGVMFAVHSFPRLIAVACVGLTVLAVHLVGVRVVQPRVFVDMVTLLRLDRIRARLSRRAPRRSAGPARNRTDSTPARKD